VKEEKIEQELLSTCHEFTLLKQAVAAHRANPNGFAHLCPADLTWPIRNIIGFSLPMICANFAALLRAAAQGKEPIDPEIGQLVSNLTSFRHSVGRDQLQDANSLLAAFDQASPAITVAMEKIIAISGTALPSLNPPSTPKESGPPNKVWSAIKGFGRRDPS
jgi:hypothetical protein